MSTAALQQAWRAASAELGKLTKQVRAASTRGQVLRDLTARLREVEASRIALFGLPQARGIHESNFAPPPQPQSQPKAVAAPAPKARPAPRREEPPGVKTCLRGAELARDAESLATAILKLQQEITKTRAEIRCLRSPTAPPPERNVYPLLREALELKRTELDLLRSHMQIVTEQRERELKAAERESPAPSKRKRPKAVPIPVSSIAWQEKRGGKD